MYDKFYDHDAIMVSGDLATRGFTPDLEIAKNFLFTPSQSTATIYTATGEASLNTDGRPIVIVPGNHDRYNDISGACAGREFDKVFNEAWPSGLRGVQAATIRNADGEGISIVSADFTLASWWNARPRRLATRFGQGRSTQRTVDELIRKSEEVRLDEPDMPLIWMCHFPPTNDLTKVPLNLRLVDQRRLVKAAKELGVNYILSGHVHSQEIFDEDGVSVIVAGSMCVPDVVKGCWMHSLWFDTKKKRAVLVNDEHFRFDFNRFNFVKI